MRGVSSFESLQNPPTYPCCSRLSFFYLLERIGLIDFVNINCGFDKEASFVHLPQDVLALILHAE